MSEMIDRLEKKTRTEIRYARGMEVMQRERYIEYCHDLYVARMRGDSQRTREIIQDLSAFAKEAASLMQSHQRALTRLFAIRFGAETASPAHRMTTLPTPLTFYREFPERDDPTTGRAGADGFAGDLEAHPRPVGDADDN
jgi:hypothetical protein